MFRRKKRRATLKTSDARRWQRRLYEFSMDRPIRLGTLHSDGRFDPPPLADCQLLEATFRDEPSYVAKGK